MRYIHVRVHISKAKLDQLDPEDHQDQPDQPVLRDPVASQDQPVLRDHKESVDSQELQEVTVHQEAEVPLVSLVLLDLRANEVNQAPMVPEEKPDLRDLQDRLANLDQQVSFVAAMPTFFDTKSYAQ